MVSMKSLTIPCKDRCRIVLKEITCACGRLSELIGGDIVEKAHFEIQDEEKEAVKFDYL
jgi:hypothetical protein